MRDMISRALTHVFSRIGGPMTFRIILQPSMAAFLGVIAGLKDARENRPPYFWTLFTDSTQRVDLIRQGWKAIARVFVLAVIMDLIYQLIEFRTIHPGEAILTVAALAILPYLLLRGPIKRLASAILHRKLVERPHH